MFIRQPFFPRARARILPLAVTVLVPIPGPPPLAFKFPNTGVPIYRQAFFPRASIRPILPQLSKAISALPPRAFGLLQIKREAFFPKSKVRWAPPKLTARGEFIETTPTATDYNIFVLKVETLDDEGNAITRWFSTKAMITAPDDLIPDQTFMELVNDPGVVKRQAFGSNRNSGFIAPTWGGVEFDNTGGDFADWIDYSTDSGKITCFMGPYRGAFPDEFRVAYIAYIDGRPIINGSTMRLNYRGRERLFDQPICTQGFSGTGGFEGTGVAGAAVMPLVIGTPGYFQPILLDPVENLWCLSENAEGPGTAAFDGGAWLNFGGYFTSIAAANPDPGEYSIIWGTIYGPLYVKFGSEIQIECRMAMSGLYGSPTVLPRRWTIVDLAQRAGVLDASADDMPTNCENLDAGNRLITGESYKQVFEDVAQYEVASIGFNRLDQFYARKILPSVVSPAVFTFTDEVNCRGVSFAPIPGLERRVWGMKVKAGTHTKSALAGVIEDVYRDAMSRDPWWTQFTAEVQYYDGPSNPTIPVRSVDPGAELAQIELISRAFPDQSRADMLAFAVRFLRLHAAKQVAFSLETELTLETLDLDLLDGVRFESDKFGGRDAIIWSIDYQLKNRVVRLGLWSHELVPSDEDIILKLVDDTEGAGGAGAGSGATGGKGQTIQKENFVIPCMGETTLLASGPSPVRRFLVPYNFTVSEVFFGLITPQASGDAVTIDMKQDGTSLFSTKPTIQNGHETSLTAGTQPVIVNPSLTKGKWVPIYVDQIGDGTAKGLVVVITGYQT